MIHDKPGRAQRRRNHATDSQLKELIEDLLSRHNLTNLAFAQDYCHMPHQTFSAIVSGFVENPRIDNIAAILRGVLKLEPNYPIERIYSVLDLPIPRLHPAMQQAIVSQPIEELRAMLASMTEEERRALAPEIRAALEADPIPATRRAPRATDDAIESSG